MDDILLKQIPRKYKYINIYIYIYIYIYISTASKLKKNVLKRQIVCLKKI